MGTHLYCLAGETTKRLIKQSKNMSDYEYSYHLYKTAEKEPGEFWLKVPLYLQNFYTKDEYLDEWFSDYKHIYKEIGSY